MSDVAKDSDDDDQFFDCTDNKNTECTVEVLSSPDDTLAKDDATANLVSKTSPIITTEVKDSETSHDNDVKEIYEEDSESPKENQTAEALAETLEKTSLEEDLEEDLTEEEKEEHKKEAMQLKDDGNQEYKQQKFDEAKELYTQGLKKCPKSFKNERSVLFSNRAACHIGLDQKDKAIEDCCQAIELNPNYVRALLRRAQLYEETEKLDEALQDYKKVLERDPSVHKAREACMKLPEKINERNEKLKAEMMGKLKDVGNLVLSPFGLSTDNFQMQQNPDTGSYNIQFVQNPQPR